MNRRPVGWFCSDSCTLSYVRAKQDRQRATKEAKARREYNKETARLRKAYTSTNLPKQKSLTQPVFNKFIRLRDRAENCISCGRCNAEVESTEGWKPGGAWDCGHFLTVSSMPELRYNEMNAYKQCKSCNGGSNEFTKKRTSIDKAYRVNLIVRIGIEKVEWLEGPHEPRKYTCEELIELRAYYSKKIREIENG